MIRRYIGGQEETVIYAVGIEGAEKPEKYQLEYENQLVFEHESLTQLLNTNNYGSNTINEDDIDTLSHFIDRLEAKWEKVRNFGECAACGTHAEMWLYTFPRHHSFGQYCYTHGKTGTHKVCRACFDKYTNKPYSV
jgi:hypothetical protein